MSSDAPDTIQRFDIWIADLNPRFGSESGKVRPVLIVQSDLLNNIHPSTLICPLSTKASKGVEILRLHVPRSSSGLEEDSYVLIDQIRAIDNRRLLKKVGHLPRELRMKLLRNITCVLDMEEGV